jgi:hypothetical protein
MIRNRGRTDLTAVEPNRGPGGDRMNGNAPRRGLRTSVPTILGTSLELPDESFDFSAVGLLPQMVVPEEISQTEN